MEQTAGGADADGKGSRSPLRTSLRGRSALISAIAIIAVSYGLFFYLQGIVEKEFRNSLFEQQQARQIESTKAIAQHIESDLVTISSNLKLAASLPAITSGDLSGADAAADLKRTLDELKLLSARQLSDMQDERSIIDGLYLVDRDGRVALDLWNDGSNMSSSSIAGTDISDRTYVTDTKESMTPQFSTGYVGADNTLRIAATQPIVGDSGDYVGMIVATMSTQPFFRHYGNIYDIESQYMAVLDSDSLQLVHPVPSLVGTPFFGEHTQNITGHSQPLNDQIRQVLTGKPTNSVYEFVNGERFNTGHPVFFRGQPVYFVFVITPTSAIYSTIDGILAGQRTQTFTVLAGTTVSIGVLIFLLARWNSGLNRVVEARTGEIKQSNARLVRANSQLEESNRQLALANDKMIAINHQLERNERIQKEFINVAAHELRTPIQPILGLAEIMHAKTSDPEMIEIIDTIERSAKRLLHLSSDILDAARIEGQGLPLNRENVEINELMLRTVQDYIPQFQAQNIRLTFEPGPSSVAYADRVRIGQVVSNLLNNATKFTAEGEVTLSVRRTGKVNDDGDGDEKENGEGEEQVSVIVKDTGCGIHEDIMPRIFTKFTTKSEKGTGLGLYISKNIIEAHGGRIWAENNVGGRGATFGFSIPLAKMSLLQTKAQEQPAQTREPSASSSSTTSTAYTAEP